MSYTGSHLHNFIPAPTSNVTASSLAVMSSYQQDRREVRPLSSDATAAPNAQASTANLEAQVRVLEQEVRLLRTGLAQNEKLRQAFTSASPQRRVHFGPSSVVPIPRTAATTTTIASANKKPASLTSSSMFASTRKPSMSPSRQQQQRQQQQQQQRRPSPSTTASTAYVPPSPAPALLPGSNTSGIPLQGAAAGATIVTAVEGNPAPSGAPAATVWTSADPSLLWKRAAAAKSGESGVGGRTDLLSSYPFSASPAGATTAEASTASAAATTASPIVVTMSSDGLPSSIFPPSTVASGSTGLIQAAPASGTNESRAETSEASAAVGNGSAPVASPPRAASTPTPTPATAAPIAPTPATASSSIPAATTEPSVEDLKRQVVELRNTLEQRESLLHRVLDELLDRGMSTNGIRTTPHRASTEEREEQSRRTLRLLTRELLAAQAQLSHARVSYQLLHEELQHRSQQPQQQPQQQQSPPDVQPAVLVVTPLPSPSPPAPQSPQKEQYADLKAQLDAALQKVKAWEDWYASTASANAEGGNSTTPQQPATEKKKKKKHHLDSGEDKNAAQGHVHTHNDGCACGACRSPPGGVVPPVSFTNYYSAEPLSGFSSSFGSAAAVPPPVSAYVFDDALYREYAAHGHYTTTIAAAETPPPKSGAATATAAAATPPPPPAGASTPPQTAPPAPVPSTHALSDTPSAPPYHPAPHYRDDLEHAKLQAYYHQQFMVQIAREAAVRELAEAERQVAEERLALLRRQDLDTTPPNASTTLKAAGGS